MRKFALFAVCIALLFVLIGCASTKVPIKEANETIVVQNTSKLWKNESAIAREKSVKSALAERLKQYEDITHNHANITSATGKERYEILRANILSTRNNFLDSCTEYDNLSKEQFALIGKDYTLAMLKVA